MKVLIAYAYAGIGHKKAAEALYKTLKGRGDVDVTTIDILDYTNAFFKFLYPRIYLFLINRTPCLWGLLYYLFDLRVIDIFFAPLRRFFHSIQAKRFIKFVVEKSPDVIVCTHFLPADVISRIKWKGIYNGRLITVITDLLPHSFWLSGNPDYFIAAIERTKKDLSRRGIEERIIRVLGIPCDPVFSISKDRQDLSIKLGLEKDLFNVLVMSGGFGTGPISEIIDSICTLEREIREKIQMVVICGKNKNLFEALNTKKEGIAIKLNVFAYMDNVDEFMESSDCIVTKSGGLTVSESLSKKLPMIIVRPIPGQETRNCKILTGYGTAVRANRVKQVRDYIKDFILFPEKIIGMKARINFLAYPDAAKAIAGFVISGV